MKKPNPESKKIDESLDELNESVGTDFIRKII